MAGGGGGGSSWVWIMVGGALLVATAMGLEHYALATGWVLALCRAAGGLAVVFGSVEAMIIAVEGIAGRLQMNTFVAGTMAGLASNIPELVMLGFVLAAAPRVGFIVVMLTLHVGVAAFGIYSGMLPRDGDGHASLPAPLVKLSTDLYACAGAVFIGTGALMMLMNTFDAGDARGEALSATDLYVIGGALLLVEVVAVVRLVKRFSSGGGPATAAASQTPMSVLKIVSFGLLGVAASVLGGHAVGEFADTLVASLTAAGYSEMVGALILSIFAAAGAFIMIGSAHAKGMYDIALANVSGQINQVPFVVLPISLILLAVFAQTGVIATTPHGGVLPIDLETTSVMVLGFPSMLILWKAVQDDGKVNWVETATMVAIFGLTIYSSPFTDDCVEKLYHITDTEALKAARQVGHLTPPSLKSEGFVHCSFSSQLLWVANNFFTGQSDLLVLVLDPVKLEAELRVEEVPEADAWFPHVYGPINLSSVQQEIPLAPGNDGAFHWTSSPAEKDSVQQLLAAHDWYDHPEGPKFVETHRDSHRTCGHWLFAPGAISAFHQVQNSDELWLIHAGRLTVHTIDPMGVHRTHTLGTDLSAGEVPILEVPRTFWQAAELPFGTPYAFGSNVCAPSFTFDNLHLPERRLLMDTWPAHTSVIQRLTHDGSEHEGMNGIP